MKTITKEEFFDLDEVDEVDYESWRHGYRVQFHVNIDGVDYLTQYLDYAINDGLQIYGPIGLFKAEFAPKMVWQRIKE